MLKKNIHDYSIIFGTTQVDADYAAKLANMIPGKKKILVDGFCERALPCSQYSKLVPFETVWHLDTSEGHQRMMHILQEKKSQKYILYGSIYLV